MRSQKKRGTGDQHGAARDQLERIGAEDRADLPRLLQDRHGRRVDLEAVDRRVAQLTGGIAVIWYGGPTDAERNERRLRLEDAVASMWAALREGVVPGGDV